MAPSAHCTTLVAVSACLKAPGCCLSNRAQVEIEPAKSLVSRLLAEGETDSEGRASLYLELNDQPRTAKARPKSGARRVGRAPTQEAPPRALLAHRQHGEEVEPASCDPGMGPRRRPGRLAWERRRLAPGGRIVVGLGRGLGAGQEAAVRARAARTSAGSRQGASWITVICTPTFSAEDLRPAGSSPACTLRLRSLGGDAAIDRENGSRDEGRCVGCEKEHRLGHLFGLRPTPDRMLGANGIRRLRAAQPVA